MTCEDVLQDLREHGWATIPLDRATVAAYGRLTEHANWFFDEPETRKQELDIALSLGHRGWVSPDQAGDYDDEGPRCYEAFDLGRTAQVDDRVEHALRGRNRWPAGPNGAAMQADAEEMFAFLTELSECIGDAICADLGVDASRLRALRTEPVSQLRMIRYFDVDQPDDGEDRAAMGAHTDYEFFTILFQDAPGTQVLDADGNWIDVAHHGVATLLVGDMLTVFSGGRYQSVLHRARPTVDAGRISIPYFAGADYSALVRSAVDDTGETVCFGNHLLTQLRRDFPYLRDVDDAFVIDLTSRGRQSVFEDRAWSRVSAASSAPDDLLELDDLPMRLQPLE
jgi:isopenicillin N synthase-like dioxygenase